MLESDRNWWTVRNADGLEGLMSFNYLEMMDKTTTTTTGGRTGNDSTESGMLMTTLVSGGRTCTYIARTCLAVVRARVRCHTIHIYQRIFIILNTKNPSRPPPSLFISLLSVHMCTGAQSIGVQSMLPPQIGACVESFATLAWADGANPVFAAAWERAKLITSVFQQAVSYDYDNATSNRTAAAMKEQYFAACRAETHGAIAAYTLAHPAASEKDVISVVEREVAKFKSKVAVVCSGTSSTRSGSNRKSEERRVQRQQRRQQASAARTNKHKQRSAKKKAIKNPIAANSDSSSSSSSHSSSKERAVQTSGDTAAQAPPSSGNRYEGVWLQANTDTVLLVGEASSVQNAGELSVKAVVAFLEARTDLSRETLLEVLEALKVARVPPAGTAPSLPRESFFMLLRAVAHVQAGRPPVAAAVAASGSSLLLRRPDPELLLTRAKRLGSPSGAGRPPSRTGSSVSI